MLQLLGCGREASNSPFCPLVAIVGLQGWNGPTVWLRSNFGEPIGSQLRFPFTRGPKKLALAQNNARSEVHKI